MVRARASAPRCECTCGLIGCHSRFMRLMHVAISPDPRVIHGTASRYDAGCRCELCVTAKRDHTSSHNQLMNETSRLTAVRHRQEWTGPELEIAVRDDLTAQEAALMLGRTRRAVSTVRKRCREDPRLIRLLGTGGPDD